MVNSPKKILVAEDEKAIAKALELKLKHEGFSVKLALNGKEALDILSKEKFDLVLLDLMMPKLDGFGVLDGLKNIQNKTPVIVVSNLGQEEDKKRVKSLGAIDFLVKSDTPVAEIVNKIKKYFNL